MCGENLACAIDDAFEVCSSVAVMRLLERYWSKKTFGGAAEFTAVSSLDIFWWQCLFSVLDVHEKRGLLALKTPGGVRFSRACGIFWVFFALFTIEGPAAGLVGLQNIVHAP